MSAESTADIDRDLLIWTDINRQAVLDGDLAAELEAREEMDVLLERRFRCPQQRPASD